MVDGIRPVTGTSEGQRIARVAATTPAAPVVRSAPEAPMAVPAAALTQATRAMASAPPVDAKRVAEIKAAIAAGKFPILPATIADRLLALRLNWDGHDAA